MSGFDPRPALALALDQAGSLISGTVPDQADQPTPCDDFTVGQLIEHLQAVVRRIAAVLSGRPFWSVPTSVPSADWAADWAEGRAATDEVLTDAGFLERKVSVPWGEVDGASAAASYVGELTVHAWDLATATNRVDRLDPVLAVGALPAYQALVPAEVRGGEIPFGPVFEVGPDAGPYERLAAWTGRDPHWSPSV